MSRYFQPHIAKMAGYAPGEQPQAGEFIKLNTNENPYPPSPRVIEAIQKAASDRLRLYPDPIGSAFRATAAQLHGVDRSMVLAGNGSDDLLTIITRAFAGPGDLILMPTPSYILYKTLAELQNARWLEVPFEPDWSLDASRFADREAKLAFLANPNSPSGTTMAPARVAELARALDCPIVVDEAYADFADSDCISLAKEYKNVIITRSLSKGSGLAGLRFGYLIASAELVDGLIKVKDSYNCDALSLAGACAALEDRKYAEMTRAKVLSTRRRLIHELRGMGYHVPESQANFVWCTNGPPAAQVYEALKNKGILVRLMRYPGYPDGLRITVGTDREIDRLLEELGWIVADG